MRHISHIIFFFILGLITNKPIIAQVIDPWTGKAIFNNSSSIQTRNGIFEGFNAQYGLLAHRPQMEHYKSLPFIYLQGNTPNKKSLIVVFNGGPGASNLSTLPYSDSLINCFSILMVGYRGVDDESQNSRQEHETIARDDFNNIACDALKVIQHYGYDTVYVVAHSFGTVYACEFLKYKGHFSQFYSLFFSPVLTRDLNAVSRSMENMIKKVFDDFECSSLECQRVLNQITNSEDPGNTALGLVLLLSKFENFDIVRNFLQQDKSIVPACELAYKQHENAISVTDQKVKYTLFFDDSSEETEIRGVFGQAIYRYFKNRYVSSRSLKCNFDICIPDTTFVAQYDFSEVLNATEIRNTAHSSVWNIAYKYIIEIERSR
ncbi:MAG: hypothetical protein PHU27_05080 [Salinivirgaceae bacterium]|nr:hypothetical protein [Salinivirgaceae bacterium]